MNGYTPTTENVREDFAVSGDGCGSTRLAQERRQWFDRWLRGIQAAAWQECFESKPELRVEDGTDFYYWPNPYIEGDA